MSLPKARIISTGSEILQGLYADTNAQRLARILFENGFQVTGISAAPDDGHLVGEAICESFGNCDLAIMTGGLGPTVDDVNREVVASLYGRELRQDDRALEMMRERYRMRGRDMPGNNARQALIPHGARTLYNDWGTAPGFVVPGSENQPMLVALPGPPSEWQPMLARALADVILPHFPGRQHRRVYTLHCALLPESQVDEALRDLFFADPAVELTLLAKRGHVRIRIIASGTEEACEVQVARYRAEVLRRLGDAPIFAEGAEDASVSVAVVRALSARGAKLALAESCTGGWLARSITDVPGSSAVFLGGVVAYDNAIKSGVLGVSEETLRTQGAVSGGTARELAEGALRLIGSDVALSTTGVAGPTGGSDEKPVGTVWFGLAARGEETRTWHRRYPGDREAVREWAALQGLEFIRRWANGTLHGSE